MLRTITWTLSLIVLSALPASAKAEREALVLGSFLNRAYAEALRDQLQDQIDLQPLIVEASVKGGRMFRVVLIPADGHDINSARTQAASVGITDPWATQVSENTLPDEFLARTRLQKKSNLEDKIPAPSARSIPASPRDMQAKERLPLPSSNMGTIILSSKGPEVDITLTRFEEGEFDLKLDGRLDEPFWQRLPVYDNMIVTDPDTMKAPHHATLQYMFYTNKGLYLGAHMQQPPDTLLPRLSSRDEFLNRDGWGITLDTSGEGLYGYWFTVNLGGSVQDGKVAAERQFSREWDGPWESATAELEDGWSAEIFLPWSMMTMPDSNDGNRNFGFYFSRKVAYLDERWTWPALAFRAPAFMSVLAQMQTPGVEPKRQLEIYPNLSYTLDEIDNEDEYRAGVDLSWKPSSNLQITATLNPDFGVVESDDVVVNLTAFETFFPEKRLFFLEGREVFQTTPRSRVFSRGPSGTGSRQTTTTFNPEPTTLLNTRRIGGPPRIDIPDDVSVEGFQRGKPSDLLGAVKVTGQSGGLRYGILGAAEDDVRLPGTINSGPNAGQTIRVEGEGRDFGVARLLFESTGRGRRSIGYMGTMVSYPDHDAIVHGVDAHWLSPNGLWEIDGQFMASDVDDVTGSGGLADISYKPSQGIEHKLTLDWLEDTLNIRDLGFIRRNDSRNVIYRFNYSTGRGLKRLRAKTFSTVVSNEWNQQGRLVRSGYFLRNSWTFKNLNEIRTEFDYFPGRWDDRNSFGFGDFKTKDRLIGEFAIGTDTTKKFSISALLGGRQEERGDWTIRSALGMTFRPNDRFSLDLDLNYFDRDGWLLHQFVFGQSDPEFNRNLFTFKAQEFQPKLAMDIFLSAKQQLRLTLQWAGIRADEQEFFTIPANEGDLIRTLRDPADRLNDFTVSRLTAQLRYRWELGPLSDLFIVYTRGSNLPDRMDDTFSDLFTDAIDEPIVDLFVIKLRYRFGL
ncbi:MAG: DUF5916 domain-containing protein [Pseudomonadota bacterium]|nr:DUF5916 domain-containing protein [Pseudomonadota bacterium]